MADPRRVAAALQYQQSQQDPFDAVPVADALGTVRVPTPSQLTWMDRLNNLSAGLGTGITNQLEGYKQMVTHPVQTAQDIGTAAVTAAKNPSIVVEALKAMGEKAASGSQGLGEVVGENMTLNPRRLAMALTHPNVSELTVYHGTPHRFPATEANPLGEFDASKIGTGEGAQAYGHGIYVAESPDVAGQYLMPNMTRGFTNRDSVPEFMRKAFAQSGGKKEAAIQILQDELSRTKGETKASNIKLAIKSFEKGESPIHGSLYHVDLPDEMIDKMLDWDKPLSEQPESVKQALMKDKRIKSLYERGKIDDMYANGGEYYRSLVSQHRQNAPLHLAEESAENWAQPATSQALKELGIPGIRYLDAGSRDAKTGTRNFVVFPGEEKNLKILERK